MKKFFLTFCFALSGCTSTHEIVTNSMQKTLAAQDDAIRYSDVLVKLPLHATAYMAYPNNGYDELHSYPDSAPKTMTVLSNIFKPYFKKLGVAKSFNSAQFEYLAARDKHYEYFILPRLLQWTDSYTFFTGVANKVVIDIKIYDLRTNQLIDEIHIQSESSKIPGFEKTPPDLLKEPLTTVAGHLFMQTENKDVPE